MRILFLSGWLPYPPDNGSKVRILNLLRGLSNQHQVTLLAFRDPSDQLQGVEQLRSFCADVQVLVRRPFFPRSLRALLGFFSPVPRSLFATFSPEMKQAIRREVGRQSYSLIIASQITMASYWSSFDGTPSIFEEVELGAIQENSVGWRRFRRQLTWAKTRSYLAGLLPHFRACTVVSEKERELLRQAVPYYRNVVIVPNCVDLPSYTGITAERQKKRLIFPGALTYSANYDGILFFLKEVFPLILQ
ncbi:MAG: glycosyltransferase, partial [Candidatus Micrarchaeaceae archaeon]